VICLAKRRRPASSALVATARVRPPRLSYVYEHDVMQFVLDDSPRFADGDHLIAVQAHDGGERRSSTWAVPLMRRGRVCEIDGYENTGRDAHAEVAEGKMP